MSYAEDFEDDGAIQAEQDSFIEDCEELDGNCKAKNVLTNIFVGHQTM